MKKTLQRTIAVALFAATAVTSAFAATDQFGVTQMYPTKSGGMEWYSKWNNGVARSFSGVDPQDSWFDAAHGAASYKVDGKGLFYITGSTPRMYVHDPAKVKEWHDVEMTVYAMRVADDSTAYGGIVGVTRSNHGTTAPELQNLCDTRGYGGRVRYDGNVDFDKETSHPNATAVAGKPLFSGGMPHNKWIGYKHVTYDMPNGHVMNEIWIDQTDGANGGTWTKVNSFEDTGSNMGVGAVACKSGINPATILSNSDARPGSESGKPNITVYWRSTNVGTNGLVYKKMSVREITPSSGGTPTPPPVASAPAISNIVATNLTDTGATIGWTTDKVSHSQVEYGLTTAYGSLSYQSSATGTSHSIPLAGLKAGTVYHYRVKSLDSATGLTGVSGDMTLTTTGGVVATAPAVSNVSASPTDTGAAITWATDKVSHSQVEYGLTSSYGSLSYQSTATGAQHSLTLSGLKAGTVYHYRVKSLDDTTKLTGVSGDLTFTTTGGVVATAPVVSNVKASATDTGAAITWDTDKVSHSQVEYGLTSGYGTLSYQSTATGAQHSLTLSGLKAGTVYHYRVKSLDDATKLTGVSADMSFTTTGGTPAPSSVISNVQASAGSSGATITWNTTTISHSQVEYGLTTSYGSQSYQSTATGAYHNIPLSGLKAGTTYHYRVKSLNGATGKTDVSGDYTFKTSGVAGA